MDRVKLWQNYLLAALTTARSLRCPTMLVPYERWMSSNRSQARSDPELQFREMLDFLRCAGFSNLPATLPLDKLNRLIQPSQYHHRMQPTASSSEATEQLLPSAACLWNELRSGRALSWKWDPKTQHFVGLPCAPGAEKQKSIRGSMMARLVNQALAITD